MIPWVVTWQAFHVVDEELVAMSRDTFYAEDEGGLRKKIFREIKRRCPFDPEDWAAELVTIRICKIRRRGE